MRGIWILIIILSACANRNVELRESEVSAQAVSTENIVLLETYQRTVTGGKERIDGKHTSTNYFIVLSKSDAIQIEKVYLYGEKRVFESFTREGKFYIVVQTYPNAVDASKGEVISSSAAAVVYYLENGKQKTLKIDEFPVREAIQGN